MLCRISTQKLTGVANFKIHNMLFLVLKKRSFDVEVFWKKKKKKKVLWEYELRLDSPSIGSFYYNRPSVRSCLGFQNI